MNNVTKRFIETYKEMGLTGYRMGKDCSSITKQKISNIENNLTEASIDMVSNFCDVYPNVNANYILTGKGNMFLNEESSEEEEHLLTYEELERLYETTVSRYERLIGRMEQKFKALESAFMDAKGVFINEKSA